MNIQQLNHELKQMFDDQTNGGDFGIIKINFPLDSNLLTIFVKHYKLSDVTFKISFNDYQSYMLTKENLPDKTREQVIYAPATQAIFLKEIVKSEYLNYLNNWTDLKIYFDDRSFEQIRQYSIITQNLIIDVVTDTEPSIEILY
ncbi:hypothetical protein [Pedobacter frigidisoli]|uniref:hypothetical protein n=1 Tax=Pedobacter frigidisoli TaxID=2530455 RepID=UPI002930DE58|nr:hypothetical protein [Pedobacter frigidisoli]